jgi:hypothetical protein
MTSISNALNSVHIPDFWQLVLSFTISIILIYLIEWIKQPRAEISLQSDLNLKDGRKFLKVKVKIKKSLIGLIFPWQNPATFAKLKGSFIDLCDYKQTVLFTYTIKWDNNPEPLDYLKDGSQKLKIELIPATSAAQNFLVGDEDSAAVAVKNPGEEHFYAYDVNYYLNPQINLRSEKKIMLRLTFNSGSISTKKDFLILNGNSTTESFILKEI